MNGIWRIALAIVAASAAVATAAQETFPTPEAAAQALVAAAKAEDQAKLQAILGPGSEDIVDSGDEVADDNAREDFVERSAQKLAVEKVDDTRAILVIGDDDWPFPIPLVADGGTWRFDAPAGVQEILNRRIGRNELYAIAVSQEYVEAQRAWSRLGVAAGEAPHFASRITSTAGKHDGLYWPQITPDEPQSPLGPLVARGEDEGYGKPQPEGGGTFHGYKYRILTEQGAHAPGGAKSWLHDGALVGGFGLIAYPAEYGVSGVMTFIVNQQGVVFQKDLGEQTAKAVEAIKAYDPDKSWKPAMVEP